MKTYFTFPRAEAVYAVDSNWLKIGETTFVDRLVEAYPSPEKMPPDFVQEASNEAYHDAVQLINLYARDDDGRVYAITPPERMGLRATYTRYGTPFGAENAGVGFGFTDAFAEEGLNRLRAEAFKEHFDDEVKREIDLMQRGQSGVWCNAYDAPFLWDAFEALFGDRFGDSAEYEDEEIWVRDAEVYAINYWDGSNFRTLFVAGLGSDHEDYGIGTDLEVVSPAEQLWFNTVNAMCVTRAGEISPGIVAYTPDGNTDDYPRKLVSHWAGSGWFYHEVEAQEP